MRWLLALLLVLVAFPAYGADGDAWGAYTDTRSGAYDKRAFLICDAKVAADSTCTEFDLEADGRGSPLFFSIQIILIDPQCSGTPDFQVTGAHTSAGVTTNLRVSMSEAGTNSQEFDTIHRYINVTLSDDAACDAPGNTLAIILAYER
jgi:hypothetical protein